jgi:hypothetical protein
MEKWEFRVLTIVACEAEKRFKESRTSVVDAHGGRLSTVTCVDMCQICQRVHDNGRMDINKTSSEMSNNHGKKRLKNVVLT